MQPLPRRPNKVHLQTKNKNEYRIIGRHWLLGEIQHTVQHLLQTSPILEGPSCQKTLFFWSFFFGWQVHRRALLAPKPIQQPYFGRALLHKNSSNSPYFRRALLLEALGPASCAQAPYFFWTLTFGLLLFFLEGCFIEVWNYRKVLICWRDTMHCPAFLAKGAYGGRASFKGALPYFWRAL